tara:strand:- start:167 stop:367 length:201 start_codon:yes stop_codon:yes gene_type:complete
MTITITPNTNRLRQLCRSHGIVWKGNLEGPRQMPCFDGQLGLNITSLDGTHNRNVPFNIVMERNIL